MVKRYNTRLPESYIKRILENVMNDDNHTAQSISWLSISDDGAERENARNNWNRLRKFYQTNDPFEVWELHFGEPYSDDQRATSTGPTDPRFPGNERLGDKGADQDTETPDSEGQGYYLGDVTVPALIFENVKALDGEDIAIPADIAKMIVKLYSELGADMQMREVCDYLGMDISVFKAIRNRMGLTHKSPDVIDEELEELTLGELFDRAEQSLAEKKMVYRLAMAVRERKKSRRELQRLRNERDFEDKFIDAVIGKVAAIPYKQPECVFQPSPDASLEPILCITDVHAGEKNEKEILVSKHDNGVEAINRRKELLKMKIERNMVALGNQVTQGHLFSLGDLFDGVFPIINPFQEIKQDLYGEDQFMFGLELMIEIILHYAKFVRPLHIWGVSGNHDSTRSSRWNIDACWLAMKWAQDRLRDYSDIIWHTDKSRFKSVGIGDSEIIGCHGTGFKGGEKSKQEDGKSILLMSNGGHKRFRYVVHGHYHDFDITPLPRGFQKVQCHAFTGANLYVEEMYKTWNRPAQDLLVFHRHEGLVEMRTLYLDDNDPLPGLVPIDV